MIGGSDAHTLASLAKTCTGIHGARNAEDYLAGLWRGASVPSGESGDFLKLNSAVFATGGSLVQEKRFAV